MRMCQEKNCANKAVYFCEECCTTGSIPGAVSGLLCEEHEIRHARPRNAPGNRHNPELMRSYISPATLERLSRAKPYKRDTKAACKFDGRCYMHGPDHWDRFEHKKQDKALPKPASTSAAAGGCSMSAAAGGRMSAAVGGSMSAAAGGRQHVGSQSADPFDLRRFVNAQKIVFAKALAEIKAGSKDSHWMWYLCPTPPYAPDGVEVASAINMKYALRDPPPRELEGFQAARAYLDFPEEDKVSLRRNLRDIFVAIAQQLEQGKSACSLLGRIDARKLESSVRLFYTVTEETKDGQTMPDAEIHGICCRILDALKITYS